MELSPVHVTLVSVVMAGSLMMWTLIAARWSRGEAAVHAWPRRIVPWGGLEVAGCFGLMIAIYSAISRLAGADPEIELAEQSLEVVTNLAIAAAATGLAALGCAVAVLLVSGAGPRDLGLSLRPREVAEDVGLGFGGFLAAAIPVYGLQMVLVQWMDYEHPILTMLTEHGGAVLWIAAAAGAILVAPIVEEFFFRQLLQGWLEKLVVQRHQHEAEPSSLPTTPPADEIATDPSIATPSENPYHSPQAAGPMVAVRSVAGQAPGVAPVVVSALLFALFHFGHGPAPVPLFLLGLVLGYLYRQTQRLLPCVVMHMVFNAVSMGLMRLSLPASAAW